MSQGRLISEHAAYLNQQIWNLPARWGEDIPTFPALPSSPQITTKKEKSFNSLFLSVLSNRVKELRGEIEWKWCGKQRCSIFYYMIVGEKFIFPGCGVDGIKHLYMLTPPSNEALFKASQGVKLPALPPRRSCGITWEPTHVSTDCSRIKPPLVYLANPAWQEVATADTANAFSTASRFTPRNLKKKKNITKCHVSAYKKLC